MGPQRQDTFERLLKFTDLATFTDRLAGALLRRNETEAGACLCTSPETRLLLLDEPSISIDPISRRELWQMVEELVDKGSESSGAPHTSMRREIGHVRCSTRANCYSKAPRRN